RVLGHPWRAVLHDRPLPTLGAHLVPGLRLRGVRGRHRHLQTTSRRATAVAGSDSGEQVVAGVHRLASYTRGHGSEWYPGSGSGRRPVPTSSFARSRTASSSSVETSGVRRAPSGPSTSTATRPTSS